MATDAASEPEREGEVGWANYRPTQRQLLRDVFGVEPPVEREWKPET